MKIRYETVGDADGIRAVVTQAFARTAEAELVDALRAADAPRISLVADAAGMIVGHVLFTTVTVRRGEDAWSALALGPLAVLPSQSTTCTLLIMWRVREGGSSDHELPV